MTSHDLLVRSKWLDLTFVFTEGDHASSFHPFWVPSGVRCFASLSHFSVDRRTLRRLLADLMPNHWTSRSTLRGTLIRNVSWLCETVRYPFWRLTPHSIDTLFWTTMSAPNDPRENHLKCKFEELGELRVEISDAYRSCLLLVDCNARDFHIQ